MACSSPLLGFRMEKINLASGEIEYVRFRKKEEGARYQGDIHRVDNKYQFLKSTQFKNKQEMYSYYERLKNTPGFQTAEIPCGRCLECRLEYARQWANRCMLEALLHDDNWFITLTYDDDHLPKNKEGYPTLKKTDLQKFNKDLREYMRYHYQFSDVRFFASGEYGDTSGRPHYHVIFFNLPIGDLEYKFSKGTKSFFTSETVSKIWKNGNCLVSPVDWDNCAYTAKYVIKKAKGDTSSVYDDLDIEPEFSNMSRRPGIAREYFDSHSGQIYKYDSLSIPGVGPVRPSHYYDKLFDNLDPVKMCQIKEHRKAVAEASEQLVLQQTDLSPLEYIKNKHDALVKKMAQLKRDQI